MVEECTGAVPDDLAVAFDDWPVLLLHAWQDVKVVLALELRNVKAHKSVRVLRYVADEGSAGWLTFYFLATAIGTRGFVTPTT